MLKNILKPSLCISQQPRSWVSPGFLPLPPRSWGGRPRPPGSRLDAPCPVVGSEGGELTRPQAHRPHMGVGLPAPHLPAHLLGRSGPASVRQPNRRLLPNEQRCQQETMLCARLGMSGVKKEPPCLGLLSCLSFIAAPRVGASLPKHPAALRSGPSQGSPAAQTCSSAHGFPTPSEPRVLTAVAAGAGPRCTRGANHPPRTATHLRCLHLRLPSFLGRGGVGAGVVTGRSHDCTLALEDGRGSSELWRRHPTCAQPRVRRAHGARPCTCPQLLLTKPAGPSGGSPVTCFLFSLLKTVALLKVLLSCACAELLMRWSNSPVDCAPCVQSLTSAWNAEVPESKKSWLVFN